MEVLALTVSDLAEVDDTAHDEHPLGLSGQVYDTLVSMILGAELLPLQPLRIHSFATALGVSATPVREALVRASAIGLVERENNKGFRVAPRPGVTELDELFEARITLEAATADLAANHAGDSLIDYLEETWNYQRAWVGSDGGFEGFRAFLNADHAFHARIAQASGNRFLAAALEMLGGHVHRFRSFDEPVVTDQTETLAEHRAIIEALRRANSVAAQSAMTLHLSNLQSRVRRERAVSAENKG